jgi:hypothetical protein
MACRHKSAAEREEWYNLSEISYAIGRNEERRQAVVGNGQTIDLETSEAELRELAARKLALLDAETALLVWHGDGR